MLLKRRQYFWCWHLWDYAIIESIPKLQYTPAPSSGVDKAQTRLVFPMLVCILVVISVSSSAFSCQIAQVVSNCSYYRCYSRSAAADYSCVANGDHLPVSLITMIFSCVHACVRGYGCVWCQLVWLLGISARWA